jgi:hypothetical protein
MTTSTYRIANASVAKEPPGAEQVGETLGQLAANRRSVHADVDPGHRHPAHEEQRDQREQVAAPGGQERDTGGEHADEEAGESGTHGLLREGTEHALHPVRREQLVGGQQCG